MLACAWVITFAFPFPSNCTREDLLGLLHSHAKEWMGWERFPWRITRDLHHFIDDPPVNFHYLLIQHCVTALACHVVLSAKFLKLDDVLDMLIRQRFEFVGVLRHELIRSLQSLRDAEGKAHIPDCSVAAEGDRRASEEEILRRRRAVMNAFLQATEETARILNYASQESNRKKHVAGHSIEAWARGDSMPSPQELMVSIEQLNGETVISPQAQEVCQFARVNRPVPKLVVSGLRAQNQVRLVEEPKSVVSGQDRAGSTARESTARKPERTEQVALSGGPVSGVGVTRITGGECRSADRALLKAEGDPGAKFRVKFTLDAESFGDGRAKADISNTEVRDDLAKQIAAVGQEVAGVKRENEELKGRLADVLRGIARQVDPEFFNWIFVVLGAGSVNKAATLLGLPNASLDVQLKKYTARGGMYRTLWNLVEIRRKLGVKTIDRFDETLAAHQGEQVRDDNVVRDLLEGLEALNGENWEEVKTELIDLIASTGL